MSEEKPKEEPTPSPLGALLSKLSVDMDEFKKRYRILDEIQYPLEISGFNSDGEIYNGKPTFNECKVGDMVMVRMCDATKATHLGIFLGSFSMGVLAKFDTETKVLYAVSHLNPAMLIPKLGRIVWGCETFWGPIKSEAELRQVTDAEINDIWYVKALKQMQESGSK